ncbi:MAG: entericidin A/B family lipoprotein [Rhodocyclaceae bacterium]|nr:entericidin A/B family lipoprotein [Rhodocyclaceae bacterium]
MKRFLALILACGVILTGCNTVAGVGRDIEAGGDKIERSAERAR